MKSDSIRTSHGLRAVVFLLLLFGSGFSLAQNRHIAIVMAPPASPATPTPAALADALRGNGFRPPALKWGTAHWVVYTSVSRAPMNTPSLFTATGNISLVPGVIGAGEIVRRDPNRIQFYSGRILVTFGMHLPRPALESWARRHRFRYLRPARFPGPSYLFTADVRPSRFPAVVGLTGTGLVRSVRPIVYTMKKPQPNSSLPDAGYHKSGFPTPRLVIFHNGTLSWSDAQAILAGGHIVGAESESPWMVQFSSNQELETALEDIRDHPAVIQIGPVISEQPLRFLTDQLIVRFDDKTDMEEFQMTVSTFGLEYIRNLPYLKNGVLYQIPGAAYGIYDAANELVTLAGAVYALPNIVTVYEDASIDTPCIGINTDRYLEVMNINEAWERLPASGEAVTLAVFDRGIHANGPDLYCDRLGISAAIDLATMKSGTTSSPTTWCSDIPQEVFENWSDDHGNMVALTAAASHSKDDDEYCDLLGIAPGSILLNAKRRGSDAGVMSEIAFSDALYWLAGGDPGWTNDGVNYDCPEAAPEEDAPADTGDEPVLHEGNCQVTDLPGPLPTGYGADIINMSFTRPPDPVQGPCANPEDCAVVCADLSDCSVAYDTLATLYTGEDDAIRDGGVIVVTSVGIKQGQDPSTSGAYCYEYATGQSGQDCRNSGTGAVSSTLTSQRHTMLAESPSTIAVGSVNSTDGKPFEIAGECLDCMIHWPSDGIELVAPMGGASDTELCATCLTGYPPNLRFGESSAAAAAISGVASLLLRINPLLTSKQVRCILQKTSADNRDEGKMWHSAEQWFEGECAYSLVENEFGIDHHSRCFGFGMVDAGKAAEMAASCGTIVADAETEFGEGADPCGCLAMEPAGPDRQLNSAVVTLGRLSIVLEVNGALSEDVIQILRCRQEGNCECPPNNPDCIQVEVTGLDRKMRRKAEFELCAGHECTDLPKKARRDRRLTKTRIIPLRINAAFLERAVKSGARVVLRIKSSYAP